LKILYFLFADAAHRRRRRRRHFAGAAATDKKTPGAPPPAQTRGEVDSFLPLLLTDKQT